MSEDLFKLKNERLYKIFFSIAVLFSCTLIIVLKCSTLNSIRFDFDVLKEQMKPIQLKLNIRSKIGFYTTEPDSTEIYKQVKFVLAPQAFVNEKCDSMLCIQRKGVFTLPNHYRLITKNKSSDRIISLIVREK